MLQVFQQKRIVIYLDETMFTSKTLLTHDYSNIYTNIQIDYKKLNKPAVAVVAAITAEAGVLTWMNFLNSVNIPKFIQFLQHLLKVMKNKKFCVFMDNLSVHRSNLVRDFMMKNDIAWLFNVPYSPDTNPIENVFSIVKKRFKQLRTNQIINGGNQKQEDLINQAFGSVQKQSVVNMIRHSLDLIQNETATFK